MPEVLKKGYDAIGSGVQKLSNGINRNIEDPMLLLANVATSGVPEILRQVNNEVIQPALPKGATPPPILPPIRMPTLSDQQAERRNSIIEQLKRRGRASTILTDNTDTLG